MPHLNALLQVALICKTARRERANELLESSLNPDRVRRISDEIEMLNAEIAAIERTIK
jgi:hypothetical protein